MSMLSHGVRAALRMQRGILAGARRPEARWTFLRTLSALPDHKTVYMPKLSPTMEVGTVQEWKKTEGDEIEAGDVLAEIETDKATRSFEYNDDGFLARVYQEEGAADVPVGDLLCIIVEEEGDIAAFKDYTPPLREDDVASPSLTPAAKEAPASPVSIAAPVITPAVASGARVIASPLAKHTATQAGVSLRAIAGTGPGGRVLAADVHDAVASGATQTASAPSTVAGMPSYVDVPVTKYKKVTAERLVYSKTTVPHYYLSVQCCVDDMLKLRSRINSKAKDGKYKLSVNDFVIKAAATALRQVPEVNSQWMGDTIRMFDSADISIAVQTEQGLITPIVKDADRKGLKEISADVKSLAGKAKENALAPEEFMGGTFTISNLGMFGVNNFCAIVNPPQAAILAVGNTVKTLVPDDNSESGFAIKNMMGVTLSCDHRVIDGAIGAQWLQAFKRCMEDVVENIM